MTQKDQLGRTLSLEKSPRRIISLVPSQTELLYALGLEDQVVGITKFCVHPPHWQTTKIIVGGTKNIHLERIRQLQPELIIANKEENDRKQIDALIADYPVYVSRITDLPSALEMINDIGQITDTTVAAQQLSREIETSFTQLSTTPLLATAYFIWRKPYMVSGGDTFINSMLELAGFHNVFNNQNRYPEINEATLQAAQPDVILLSSEPFPFKEKHCQELKILCPQAVIRLVDGELFSWYGSRLLRSASYFRKLRQEIVAELE